jgi:3-hydroxyacyl-CoA dehydrogenase
VEKHRKPGTLITTNTSGIPIHAIAEGRSDDFRKHFCGTHFFNPPRYCPLLEIIPGPDTDPAVLRFLKTTASASSARSPCSCQGHAGLHRQPHRRVRHHGPVPPGGRNGPHRGGGGPPDRSGASGHPKSATFRTADVVGLDTLVKVAQGVKDNCPKDEQQRLFSIPGYLQKMVEKDMLGSKTGKGFLLQGPQRTRARSWRST